MQYTTVLFDLDGTLTKSEEGITKTAIYAAEKMGFTGFTQEQFKVFIVPPLYDSFRKVVGMTEEQANQAIDHYHERFERVGWAENEVYACIPGQPMLVTVSAVEDTSVLFMNVGRVLTTCTNACPFHTNLARNLLTVCAHKSLQLSQRILHTSSKSIRGRLMSYFSECAKHAGSNSFLIPYNRQQLADYLNVDRSTMCNELSKMQKDGMIEYKKNRILLKD